MSNVPTNKSPLLVTSINNFCQNPMGRRRMDKSKISLILSEPSGFLIDQPYLIFL